MTLRSAAILTLFVAQAQAPPPSTPPTSPFAAAAIQRPEAPAGETAGPVILTFKWNPGMTATIDAQRSKTTVTPAGRNTATGGLRYRMRVDAHKDGRLISYDSFEPVGVALEASEQSALDQTLSTLMPSLIVAKSGDFVRVGDLSAVRAAVKQLVDAARKQAASGAMPANLQAMLDGLTSDEVLSQVAAAEWQTFVGAFVGFEGKVGKMLEFSSEEPSPIVPGLVVPMRTTMGARERVPCEPGSAPDSCVVMQIRSVVAPGAMQSVIKKIVEGMKDLDGVTYETFDVTTEVLTTLEPATMRPYQVIRTKTADFSVNIPGEGKTSASMTDRRTYRITYQQR